MKATKLDGTDIPVTMHVDRDSMGTWDIAPKALKAAANEAANALNLYREIFGVDYPFARLDLVNDPLGFLYGQAPSSLVYLGSGSLWSKGVLGSIGGANFTKFVHALVAHEVAHQWWGSAVSNANARNYWFIESLAEYASSLFVGAVDGTKAYLAHVADWRREILESDLMVSVQDAPEMWGGEGGGYRAALYAKGPYFFHILRSTWGDEQFFAFLKSLAQELEGKEIVTRDIQLVAERSFQTPMERLFDQWIRGVGIPEYTFKYEIRPLEDGEFVIDGTIEQRVVVGYDKHLLEGEYFEAMVPVTVLGKKSGYKKNLIIRGESTPFMFKVPEEPRKIILNHNGEVLAHDVAAPIATGSTQSHGWVRNQRLPSALEDLSEEAGRERELVALPDHGERLDFVQGKKIRQIVAAEEGPLVLHEPSLSRRVRRCLLIRDLGSRRRQIEVVPRPLVKREAGFNSR